MAKRPQSAERAAFSEGGVVGSATVGETAAFVLWNLATFGMARTSDRSVLKWLAEKLGNAVEVGDAQHDDYNWTWIWPLRLKGRLTITRQRLAWNDGRSLEGFRYDLSWLVEPSKRTDKSGDNAQRG